ncbi:MAG: hypothetical protein ACOC7Y_01740 [Chloroflexota bacterium]
MAELFLAEEWAEPSPVAIQLHYDLSGEYLVVSRPTVHGCELDTVVVGPPGLFVVHVEDGGAPPPAADSDGKEDSGPPEREERVAEASQALRAFMRDEFPSLTVKLHHLLVVDDSEEEPSPSTEPPVATVATAAEAVASVAVPDRGASLDEDTREALAVALRDRRLTSSQRASQPFIFRSGDGFGSGTEVRTIREAVRHMAAHPESGIYHLRNGTLAAWLQSEGAEHLARVARDVVRTHTDRRAALEMFLIETGLVERPRLRVRPRHVDLGYLTAGDAVARRIRIRKGSGRGYLFGKLEASVPWLSLYPRTFDGESDETVVSVRAETESLPIDHAPRDASVYIHSNASPEPLEVPVRFRLVGVPSALNRRLLRPAAGLLVAGALGAGLGALLSVGGAPAAGFLAGLPWLPLSPAAVWVVAVALGWAVLGALRGASQPEAWPVGYAMGRWLFRILVWAVALVLVGVACLWCWGQLRPGGAGPLPRTVFRAFLAVPMALSILPATVGEIRSGPEMRDTSLRAIRWSFLRPFVLPLIAGLLALGVALGAPRLRPALERFNVPAAAASVGTWTEDRLLQLGERLDGAVDELYLRYYDRRAPAGGGEGS